MDGRPRAQGPHVVVAGVDGAATEVAVHGHDAHHLARVLRVRRGDAASVTDGAGRVWEATATSVTPGLVDFELGARRDIPRPSPTLTVVHGLPKGRKLDEVVQRLTELGVDRLVPARTRRSQVHVDGDRADRAVDRWRRVAKAAAEQSRRAWLLEVVPVVDWSAALEGAVGVVCWEDAEAPLGPAIERCAARDADAVVVAVGPEGGLTAEEAITGGLPAVRLGDSILRTETAGVVAAAIALHRLGRLG